MDNANYAGLDGNDYVIATSEKRWLTRLFSREALWSHQGLTFVARFARMRSHVETRPI